MVVAIIGVLAGIGAGLLNDMIPAWRTRQAAQEFQGAVSQARSLAIADGAEYRILFMDWEDDPAVEGTNIGEYVVQKKGSGSDGWVLPDTLPVELTDVKELDGEGYVNIGDGQEDSLPQVSLAKVDLAGDGDPYNVNAIVFSPAGTVENAPDDFACDITGDTFSDGFICIKFVNKRKAVKGADDSWSVIVSRAGMARLHHSDAGTVGHAVGTAANSTATAGTPTGYVGPNTEDEDTGGPPPT